MANILKETLDFFKNDELRARVFSQKYAKKNSKGEIVEKTPIQMWERLATEIAKLEEEFEKWKNKFLALLKNFKFIPGGRIMYAVGNELVRAVPVNCFVIPILEDSIEGIFEAMKNAARTYALGGGVGISLSILRPKNSKVNNSAVTSTGSISFADLFSQTTGTIGQEGRRGAMILTLHDCHPDVEDFISLKNDPERKHVRFANISVSISDAFMKAVEEDSDWELWYADKMKAFSTEEELQSFLEKNPDTPILKDGYTWYEIPSPSNEWILMTPLSPHVAELRKKKIYKRLKARTLWDKLVKSSWESAEPGILFIDNHRNYSSSEKIFKILTVNPCGEMPLSPFACCNLGSFNLSEYVNLEFTENAYVDLDSLYKDVGVAVRFLDNLIDYTASNDLFPLERQKEAALKTRRIGIGITGLADMLAKLRLPYDSDEALSKVDEVLRTIKRSAYFHSSLLAKERGCFEGFTRNILTDPTDAWYRNLKEDLTEDEWKSILDNGLRNSALLTVPPVGSGSILAGTSSGIEPIFFLSYTRRFESLDEAEMKSLHPLYKRYLTFFGLDENSEPPDFFKTAHQVDTSKRISMQRVVGRHIDSSISSTVNLPEETTEGEISDLFFNAWKSGLKGITIYREGSRQPIIASSDKKEETQEIVSPIELSGKRFKFKISEEGSRKANCWVSIFGNDKPIELFITVGKSGTALNSLVEALGRAISLGLRRGVPASDYIDGLSGIKAQRIRQEDSTFIQSIPDGVARALQKFIDEKQGGQFIKMSRDSDSSSNTGDICPNCGEILIHGNGCCYCSNCGYSRCG